MWTASLTCFDSLGAWATACHGQAGDAEVDAASAAATSITAKRISIVGRITTHPDMDEKEESISRSNEWT